MPASSSSHRKTKREVRAQSDQITDLQKTISGLEAEVKTLKSQMEIWFNAILQSVSLIMNINNNLNLKYLMFGNCFFENGE